LPVFQPPFPGIRSILAVSPGFLSISASVSCSPVSSCSYSRFPVISFSVSCFPVNSCGFSRFAVISASVSCSILSVFSRFQPLFPLLRPILAVFPVFLSFSASFSVSPVIFRRFFPVSCHFSLCFLISCFSAGFPCFPVNFILCFLLLFSAFFSGSCYTWRNLTRTNIDSWSRDAHGLYIHQA
jgi:hypothetical protein